MIDITISNQPITVAELKNKNLDTSLLEMIQYDFRGNCPLYFKKGGNFSLIQDCAVNEEMLPILTPSFPAWLYRGGGVVNIKTHLGKIVRYDDRHQWWKPAAAGIASIEDGNTPREILINSALRELDEEITIYKSGSLIKLCNKPYQANFTVNDINRAIEAVIHIDLSNYRDLKIIGKEDNGITPIIGVLNQGRIIGIYSQTQGYIDLEAVNVHASVL